MNLILFTVITLLVLSAFLAIILYLVAQKFKVVEDPRIDEVEACLPGANCGGCGSPGCRGFAEACVKADSIGSLFCPAGGNAAMAKIAQVLGQVAVEKDPMVAVVRCAGSFEHRPKTNTYDSVKSCAVASTLIS